MQNQLTPSRNSTVELLIKKDILHMVVESWGNRKEWVHKTCHNTFFHSAKIDNPFKLSAYTVVRNYFWIKSCNKYCTMCVILLLKLRYMKHDWRDYHTWTDGTTWKILKTRYIWRQQQQVPHSLCVICSSGTVYIDVLTHILFAYNIYGLDFFFFLAHVIGNINVRLIKGCM